MKLLIIGNPENRRVRDFQTAAGQLQLERPECVSWNSILSSPDSLDANLGHAEQIRLESTGENDEVLHQLIQLGGSEERLEFGEIGLLREQFLGSCQILDRIESSASKSNGETHFQNPPSDIKVMFDKWESHRRFRAMGIPRPLAKAAPTTIEQFRKCRSEFGSQSSGRLFLKPRYSSSASGVCAYRWSGDREQIIAPIAIQRSGDLIRLFNTLRVRTYTRLADTHAILSKLLPQDMIAEKWVQKIKLSEGRFDLRILVIAGEAKHTVARQSNHPMTNLHLGNQRANWNAVREVLGETTLKRCRQLSEDAANCFPDSLYAGVDLLIPAKGDPLICEINAFGDLLPNLYHQGESPYESILKAAHVCRHSI